MKVVAVVPMKLNNMRLPQKNTKKFTDGNPLCQYVLKTIMDVETIDEVYVYCSNPKIVEYLPSGVKYLKRSEWLDANTTSMNEVLNCFANEIYADIYVLSHTTAPFISKKSINAGVNAVLSGEYDSSFSVKKIQDFLWKDNKPMNYSLEQIPRTQDLPPLFMETSGFYVFKRELITERNQRIGDRPCLIEVDEIESCDIDEPEDFLIADAIQLYLNREGFVHEK